MILKRCAIGFGLLMMLLLSGCAHMNDPKGSHHFEVLSPAMRQAKLAKVKAWRIHGSFSIQMKCEKPFIANYVWVQLNPRDYRISISSALNLFSIELYNQYGSVELWKNGVHVYKGKSARALVHKAMGWSLPVTNMRYWVKGIPAPVSKAGSYKASYDQYGHLTYLKQDGWTICYSVYTKDVDYDMDLPQVITLERPGFKMRMILRRWELLAQHQPMLDAIM